MVNFCDNRSICVLIVVRQQSTQVPEYSAIPEAEQENSISALLTSEENGTNTQITRGGSISVRPDGSYNYAYGPGGLLGLKHNYYALLCAFFASIGGLEFGYDQGVVWLCALWLE
jgi:hypothetical protein